MADEKKPEGKKEEPTIDSLTQEARAHLLQAFRRILRPLVKILIRAGVRFDVLGRGTGDVDVQRLARLSF